MSWEAIGAVGEIVGALAVVISLVYLGTQVRHNTEVARASTRHAIADSTISAGSDILHEPLVAAAVAKELQGQDLGFEDYLRLQTRAYMGLRLFENIHYQYRSGLLSEDEWQGFRKNLKWLLHIGSYQELWRAQAPVFSDAFRHEVSVLHTEIEGEPDEFANDPILRPKLRSEGVSGKGPG